METYPLHYAAHSFCLLFVLIIVNIIKNLYVFVVDF